MPNLYARQTALTNVGGRIDYISNPDRQENLLAVHDTADAAYWLQLAQECKLASKHKNPGTKSVQGRELVVQLSNQLLQSWSAEEIVNKIAEFFKEKYGRDCVVALHFNKSKSNLHVHIIYSERARLQEPEEKVASRALFFDEEGKRRYKKAEVMDENGELRAGCRIVAKGEIYERKYFGPVDPVFSSKAWLKDCKTNWVLPLRNDVLRGDVVITEYDEVSGKLPQQHVGNKAYNSKKGTTKEQIEEYNAAVRDYNQMVDEGKIQPHEAREIQKSINKRKRKNGVLIEFLKRFKELLQRREPKKKSLNDAIGNAEQRHQKQLQENGYQTPGKNQER